MDAVSADDELEYTLLNKRDVMVYQIPPASSSAGHKADDWKKCIWRGRCRIVGHGHNLSIKMLDGTSGALFANCAIPNGEYDKYVERVIDSSRYFVLKITNGQRHAFIGLGFEDRNDAFDFNCTLSDFKSTWVDKETQAAAPVGPQEPVQDLSLKEGQKIKINMSCLEGRPARKKENSDDSGGFIGLLAPPPASGGASRRQQAGYQGGAAPPLAPPLAAAPNVQSAFAPTSEDFADFGFDDFQAAPTSPSAPAPVPAAVPAATITPTSVGNLTGQFDQLNFGAPMSQPFAAQPMQPRTSDPFAGFSGAGSPTQSMPNTAPQPSAAPNSLQAQAAAAFSAPAQHAPPAQGSKAKDPFDDFDIFK